MTDDDARPGLKSFPQGYRALVVGSEGSIGRAFAELLQADPACAEVRCIHRRSSPPLDYDDEGQVSALAQALASEDKFHLIIIATGLLHRPDFGPEKKLGDLDYARMEAVFRANTFGPALLMSKLVRRLDAQRGVLAVLSAKVGSIGDNRLGGWYSYRASKAALNMMLKTAAIEVRRTQAQSVLIALHPGTVTSALSRPFGGENVGRPPKDAVWDMLNVLDGLKPEDSGSFVSFQGEKLPW